jgi:hypothetical protein
MAYLLRAHREDAACPNVHAEFAFPVLTTATVKAVLLVAEAPGVLSAAAMTKA